MPEYEYQNFMKLTGMTDQHIGREYKCPLCGRRYWSAWGQARRHYEFELKIRRSFTEELCELNALIQCNEKLLSEDPKDFALGSQLHSLRMRKLAVIDEARKTLIKGARGETETDE